MVARFFEKHPEYTGKAFLYLKVLRIFREWVTCADIPTNNLLP